MTLYFPWLLLSSWPFDWLPQASPFIVTCRYVSSEFSSPVFDSLQETCKSLTTFLMTLSHWQSGVHNFLRFLSCLACLSAMLVLFGVTQDPNVSIEFGLMSETIKYERERKPVHDIFWYLIISILEGLDTRQPIWTCFNPHTNSRQGHNSRFRCENLAATTDLDLKFYPDYDSRHRLWFKKDDNLCSRIPRWHLLH